MTEPKEARGGTFAPADIKIIKEALIAYINNGVNTNLTITEERQIINLLHRLNRIG